MALLLVLVSVVRDAFPLYQFHGMTTCFIFIADCNVHAEDKVLCACCMIKFFVLDDEGLEWRVQQLKCYEQLLVHETSVRPVDC
jgi:hypothetical protein